MTGTNDAIPSTYPYPGGWTCGRCGQFVPYGADSPGHVCPLGPPSPTPSPSIMGPHFCPLCGRKH